MKWKEKVKCIKCGAEVYPEFPFCTKCGYDIPPKEQQSPYAIIFTAAMLILGLLTSPRGDGFLILLVGYSFLLLIVVWQVLPLFSRLSEQDAPRIRRKW
ncbi:MAG: zinc ribbon domain-containing protein [Theionarchaea archaeon]|nr:zinc ribbon domain-containing protein [Theionarchaea archaeon]MBU7020765.1 zinc ribbon domain-containing protein [Theionarchaea archaeon]MBU7035625.1 zinc ribbon domain-containing protein [Theionarchaea archaeon]MBU7041173.1 zinc ribbon domain-containing protein [Theionarchaea archaeon]